MSVEDACLHGCDYYGPFKASVVLRHRAREYAFIMDFAPIDYCIGSAKYIFEEGNYSCDCNRAIFISRYCNTRFPDMDCGDTIELVSVDKYDSVGDRGPE